MVNFDVYRPARRSTVSNGGTYWHGTMITQTNIVIWDDLRHVDTIERDYGYIRTTPSAVFPTKYNDCFQYDVSGDIRKVDMAGIKYDVVAVSSTGTATLDIALPSGRTTRVSGVSAIIDSTGTILRTWKITSGSVSKGWTLEHTLTSVHVDGGRYTLYSDATYTTYNKSTGEVKSRDTEVIRTKNSAASATKEEFDPYDGAVTVGYGDIVLGLPNAEREPVVRGLLSQLQEQCHDGDLCVEAGESIRLANINGLAFIRDFTVMGKLASSLASISGVGESALGTAKIAASVYLATHYGLKLSILDSQELKEGVERLDLEHEENRLGAERNCVLELPGYPEVAVATRTRLSGYVKNWSTEQRFFVDKVKQITRAMWEFDLVPSFANVWDFLPWTFVVDWIAPIGPAAEKLESSHYLHHVEPTRLFFSKRFTWSQNVDWISDNGSGYSGHVTSKIYIRDTDNQFRIPPLRVDSPIRNLGHHWLEASALLIQVI